MIDLEAMTPVDRIPTDPGIDSPNEGIALCLSGGGYRAMLFHLGALWRLNDAGYLPRLKQVSSVSGGSITAAVLGLAWKRLDFDNGGVARRFVAEVVTPVRRLAGKTIDAPSVLRGLFGPGSISDSLTEAYRRNLYGNKTLQDLPKDGEGPRFVINASNVQSGALWRFSRSYAADYRVGMIPNPAFDVAVAVAASSAFPPFLSPVVLQVPQAAYTQTAGADLHFPPYTTRIVLSDGGVYDNLGLETAWKRYSTILVSDGGQRLAPEKQPHLLWPLHVLRVLTMIDDQVRSRRKIQLMSSYLSDPHHPTHRAGAIWSSRSDIKEYGLPDSLDCSLVMTSRLANLPTRLRRIDAQVQKHLINWGFAVCDAAMRRYADSSLPPPGGFPFPEAGVG